MIQRSHVVTISWLMAAVCLVSRSAHADDVPYDAPPAPAVGLEPEAPREQPPPAIWDKMALRFETSYSRGHVFDVPFRGGQVLATMGTIKGPLTAFLGTDVFVGSTEAGLGAFATHFCVGADVQLWRFRFGGAVYSGFSTFARASGSKQSGSPMGSSELGMWSQATFDVLRFQSGRLPIAVVIGVRVYAPLPATITWSPAFFAGVHL